MTFNLDNHYDCPLSILGLGPGSSPKDVALAVEREMADLEDAYGEKHGVTPDELATYLFDWIEREGRRPQCPAATCMTP
jgi:hypothetical protein